MIRAVRIQQKAVFPRFLSRPFPKIELIRVDYLQIECFTKINVEEWMEWHRMKRRYGPLDLHCLWDFHMNAEYSLENMIRNEIFEKGMEEGNYYNILR